MNCHLTWQGRDSDSCRQLHSRRNDRPDTRPEGEAIMSVFQHRRRVHIVLFAALSLLLLPKCAQVSVGIPVLRIKLEEATFGGGSHTMKTDPVPPALTYGSDGSAPVRVPQIKKGEASTPICYTWESSPTISAKFSTGGGAGGVTVKVRIEGEKKDTHRSFVYEQNVAMSGSEVTPPAFSVTEPSTMKFEKQIANTTFDLTWKISYDGGQTFVNLTTTSNKLFVTAGTPTGSSLTVKRIDRVTAECEGLTAESDIVDRLWQKVVGPGAYALGKPYPSPEWKILDGVPGECIALAHLFEKTIKIIGLTPGSGSVVYVYADPGAASHESTTTTNFATRGCKVGENGHSTPEDKDADRHLDVDEDANGNGILDAGEDADGDGHLDVNEDLNGNGKLDESHTALGNDIERLVWQDGSGGWNNWEACYKYRDGSSGPYKWYAAGTGGLIYSSVQELIDHLRAKTRWQWSDPNWNHGGPCIVPGPYPEWP